MDGEENLMARRGVVVWRDAVLKLGDGIPNNDIITSEWIRHCFIVASWKLVEHVNWLIKIEPAMEEIFAEILIQSADIRLLRNLNEHKIEYYQGNGKFTEDWEHVDDDTLADASSMIGNKIGNRLDWVKVIGAAKAIDIELYPDVE